MVKRTYVKKIDHAFHRGIKPTGRWQEYSDAELHGVMANVTPTAKATYTYW
jgi:hypothetical protein